MKRTTPQYWTISIILLSAIVASLVTLCAAPPPTPPYPLQIMPSHTTRTKEAARRHQEDEAMAAATLQKEKDAAKKDGLKAVIEKDNLNAVADMNLPQEPLPMVVSPPSAPNLTSLLTGHIGQEVGTPAADDTTAKDMDINTQDDEQVDDNVKSPKKNKSKKVKSTKENKSSKRNRSSMTLKISSFAKPTLAAKPSVKEYNFERVFYEAGLELKGETSTALTSNKSVPSSKIFNWSIRSLLCTQSTSWGAQSLLAPKLK
jgi:hypothetical protein